MVGYWGYKTTPTGAGPHASHPPGGPPHGHTLCPPTAPQHPQAAVGHGGGACGTPDATVRLGWVWLAPGVGYPLATDRSGPRGHLGSSRHSLFQLFWLFQPRCRLRLKWSEVVSTVEKTFGHLKSSRRWDLDTRRTSFVLPGIGFGTSRVRKVTLQPTRRSSCRGHAASRGSAVARRSAEAGGRVMAHRPKVVPASEDQGP